MSKRNLLGKKMMKQLAAVLSAALLAMSLGACEKGGSDASSGDETQESTSAEVSTQESVEPSGSGEVTPAKQDSLQKYMAFLDGTERVYCDLREYEFYDSVAEESYQYFPDKNGYTFKEFVKFINDIDNLQPDVNIRTTNVYYAMLDCGNDGEPELGIQIATEGDLWGEGSYYQYVIKNVDDKLQIIDRMESYYRSENNLVNHYGYSSDGYYWGMGYSVSYYSVDAEGDKHYVYGEYAEYMPDTYDSGDGLGPALEKIMEREGDDMLFDGLTFLEYRFQEYEENENEAEVIKHAVDYYGGEEDTTIPAEMKGFLDEAFQAAGVKLYTQDEIDAMIEEKYQALGITKAEASYDDEDFYWQDVEREKYWPGKISVVSDAAAFMAAIEDNAMIKLEPGKYDLTKWLTSGNNLSKVPQYYGGDYSDENPAGVTFTGWDEDSYEITINRIRNLVIMSADPSNPAEIVCDCCMAKVMLFVNCGFIELDNLIMGHDIQPGRCSGDVVGFSNSFFVQVNDCDLYGCGAHGIEIFSSHDVTVRDSKIHDCTYGCMTMYDPGYVVVYDTVFENCKEYSMFDVTDGSVYFQGCTFRNLQGDMVSVNENAYVTFSDCQFDVKALESLQKNKYYNKNINIY